MACIINADNGVISGSAGVKTTADTTGVLDIQTNGVTAISISPTQVVTFPSTTSIGTLYFGAGTVTAPSISVTGDTNTGIYFPGADQIAITTAGTQRFYVGATGDIGIGTGSPGVRLEVSASGAGGISAFRIINTDTTASSPVVALWNTADDGTQRNRAGIGAGADGANNGYLYFTTRTSGSVTEKARIDNAGNFGLGVTPSAWGSASRAIQLGGSTFSFLAANVRLLATSNTYWDGTDYRYLNNSAAAYYLQRADSSHVWAIAASGTAGNVISFTNAMTLDTDGDLAIGAASSSDRLHVERNWNGSTWVRVNNTDSGAGAAAGILMKNNTGDLGAISVLSSANSPADGLFVRSLSTNPLVFGTNNTERARIDSAGNFGLGTTPSAWDTLLKAIVVTNTAVFSGQTNAEGMRLGSNWYYNSGFKYQSTGFASRYDQAAGAHAWFVAPSGTAGNAITFTQAMTLDASGRLGIGITSPSQNLTVKEIATISDPASSVSQLTFGDAASDFAGRIFYNHSADAMQFFVNAAERARINSVGDMGIGTDSPVLSLDVSRGTTTGFAGTAYRVARFHSTAAAAADQPGIILGYDTTGAGVIAADTQVTGQPLAFWTYNGSAWGERARIPSAGGFQCVNSISVGNATPTTSGAGITFPATQSASSDANTLDDYEEGTWTPSVRDGGTDRSPTYAFRGATYTKIGNTVYARWGFKLSNKGAGSGSGEIQIWGLPFTCAATGSYQEPNVSVATGDLNTAANAGIARMIVLSSGSYMFGRVANNGDTVWTYNDLTNTTWIIGEIFYQV